MNTKNKKITTSFIITAVSALLILAACNKQQTVTPKRKSITEAVYASGFLVPKNEYKVYALSDGYITEKLVDAGDEVKAGAILYKVQSDAQAAKLDASNSALQLATANASDNSPVLQDLRFKISTAETVLANDSLTFLRNKNMYESNAVSKAQYDAAALNFQVSKNNLQVAKQAYARMRDQQRLDIKNAQAQLATSGIDLSNYALKSILNGTVYETYKELGESVKKNDAVALVGDNGEKKLTLSVDQQDIDKVKIGQEVVVKMDVTSDKTYMAHVTRIYPNMNQNDQTFKVEAELNDKTALPFVHTSVEANIITSKKENALVVPRSAVNAANEVQLKSLGKGKTVAIKVGLENMEEVEVLSGIKEGEEILLPKN